MIDINSLKKIIHELFIIQKLKNSDVREIVEFKEKEIIIAMFEHEEKTIKIIAKIRENEKTIFEKIIEEKTKFEKTNSIAIEIMNKIGSALI